MTAEQAARVPGLRTRRKGRSRRKPVVRIRRRGLGDFGRVTREGDLHRQTNCHFGVC